MRLVDVGPLTAPSVEARGNIEVNYDISADNAVMRFAAPAPSRMAYMGSHRVPVLVSNILRAQTVNRGQPLVSHGGE